MTSRQWTGAMKTTVCASHMIREERQRTVHTDSPAAATGSAVSGSDIVGAASASRAWAGSGIRAPRLSTAGGAFATEHDASRAAGDLR